MSPQLVWILLSALLGAALGHRTRCHDLGGGPSSSCQQTVITCPEGERCKPQPSPGQAKQPLSQQRPACVATHQVGVEPVGDVTVTTHTKCCFGDVCSSSAVASPATPFCIVAAAVTTLAWLLLGL
ncbi:lymphocyte antigen 6 complex locus protein G6f isoform X2 [Meriones unguiculatus]|uniref:lymphocyte antigen 6 complex locus protein G6f isoform X2 n=1 Tax=Meriones unguiculatus TaxID=10047 RepID=UPI000B4F4B6B|nr:lymphocyte antigen 6 complex locus protein G6f isoform X2 [Meriones unguiculatus]